jgi:hypothetical protein
LTPEFSYPRRAPWRMDAMGQSEHYDSTFQEQR